MKTSFIEFLIIILITLGINFAVYTYFEPSKLVKINAKQWNYQEKCLLEAQKPGITVKQWVNCHNEAVDLGISLWKN